MNAAQAWSLILGFATPLLVSVITKSTMDSRLKQIIAIATSVLVGVINLLVQGAVTDWSFTWNNILVLLAAVVGASSAAYTLLWKPTGVAESIESKINLLPDKPADGEGGYTTGTTVLIVLACVALVLLILWLVGVHVSVG